MDTANSQPVQIRPYDGEEDQRVRALMLVDGIEGGLHAQYAKGRDEVNAGVEEARVSSGFSEANGCAVQSRTSELTVAFEGEVYVFPAVTPEKVRFFCFCIILCGFF